MLTEAGKQIEAILEKPIVDALCTIILIVWESPFSRPDSPLIPPTTNPSK